MAQVQKQNVITLANDDEDSDEEFLAVGTLPDSKKRVLFDQGDEEESEDEFVDVETVNATIVLGFESFQFK